MDNSIENGIGKQEWTIQKHKCLVQYTEQRQNKNIKL
jgi:hypothetical protein